LKQFQGQKSKNQWIANEVIIDTVWAIIPSAQREGLSPVALLDCGTSRRQSQSNPNHRHNLFFKSLTSNNKTIQHPISNILPSESRVGMVLVFMDVEQPTVNDCGKGL
jgi:hypothetical protein